MTAPNPVDDEDLYNAFTLGSVRSPGTLVSISGHDRKIGWDIKKGPMQKGASMTMTSVDPIAFQVEIYLADQDDFDAWQSFKDLVDSTVNGPKPKPLDAYHPDLAEQGIKSVVKDTTVGTKHDGKGGQTKIIKLIEYFPPAPAGGTPTGAKAKATEVDPNAAALAELARLQGEYQRTNWDGTKNNAAVKP